MNSSDATTFEVDHQSGRNISNIGGDQTIYYGSQAGRIGKILGAVGLFLSIVGAALLVPLALATAHGVHIAAHHGGVSVSVTHHLPWGWAVVAGLLVGGFVVKRVARILIGR